MPLGPTSKARLADCHPKLRRLAGYVSAVADELDIEINVGALWRSFPDPPRIELTDRELNRP